jgi:hypothetical protein
MRRESGLGVQALQRLSWKDSHSAAPIALDAQKALPLARPQ